MNYDVQDFELQGTRFNLTCVATFEVTLAYGWDEDIGGRDGWHVAAVELLYIDLDGFKMNRHQIVSEDSGVALWSETLMSRAEEALAIELHDNGYALEAAA